MTPLRDTPLLDGTPLDDAVTGPVDLAHLELAEVADVAEVGGSVGMVGPRAGSRLARVRVPRAVDVLHATAVEFGVCVRPFALRRIDLDTGETTIVDVPCGSTRAAVCPSCAAKARRLRAQQCREGWHLIDEPDLTPDPATVQQRDLVRERADLTDAREVAADAGDLEMAAVVAEAIGVVDDVLSKAGVRGTLEPGGGKASRRVRSTRRRADVADLPRVPALASTLGRVYRDKTSGREFRPSLFVTLTLPSYGPVGEDHTPVDPTRYDYTAAARDALHFGKLVDRWVQNLRRVAGYDVQYFAAVEPQKRGAPHIHFAIRGTLPRRTVKELTAASYATIWWPPTTVHYPGDQLPVWVPDSDGADSAVGQYVDPGTGQPLPTWGQALDDLDAAGDDAVPVHTVRFGTQVDVKGVLAGSPPAERAIGYLVKYLVKDLGDDLDPVTGGQLNDVDQGDDGDQGDGHARRRRDDPAVKAANARRADHVARLVEALRFEPCSPRCANWLRYGVQPKAAKAGLRPGCCRAKAHRPTHLGYGGRRVLVSRKWTGKDLTDHRHDRKAHVLATLAAAGHPAGQQGDLGEAQNCSATMPDADPETSTASPRWLWEPANPTDPDVPSRQQRLLRTIANQARQRAQYRTAQQNTAIQPTNAASTAW